jgi:single-strand DNA-binding protein
MNTITVLAKAIIGGNMQDGSRIVRDFEIAPYNEADRPTQIIAWVGQKAESMADILAKIEPDEYLILEGSMHVERDLAPMLRISGLSQVQPIDMPGVNHIALVGRAGRDPEVRYFESGSVVASLSLAVNRIGRDEKPDWFNLEIWGKQAQVAADYVRKGSQLGIIGRFELDHWTDRTTGEERSKPVVHVDRLELLGSKRDAESFGGGEPSNEEVPF